MTSDAINVFEYTSPLAIVFFGVPLPNRNNPYIVLVSSDADILIRVGLGEEDKASRAIIKGLQLGWRYEIALKSFIDEVSTRLEQPLYVEIEAHIDKTSYPPASSVYAATTLAIIQAVSETGGYELSTDEILQAASDIDQEAGIGLDFIDALRTAIVRGKSIIYRKGEEPIALDTKRELVLELVGEEDIGEDLSQNLQDPLASAITRLLGVNVIEAANTIRELQELDNIFQEVELNIRIENAAYYMLYGASLPDPGCKWTPSLQRVYAVCKKNSKLGDPVTFTL
jgi:mevalonate kinase